ncbi:hypothetical protein CXF45_04125 [Corynebacterium bovis]|nr:hypothetical protein CXF45_04125 [Corynebacterium bovis]
MVPASGWAGSRGTVTSAHRVAGPVWEPAGQSPQARSRVGAGTGGGAEAGRQRGPVRGHRR